jgi:ABC-2 type transport system ATP-binding protein
MHTILEVQHLKKYFSSQKAVDDVSFTLEKGSIFGLLGPNGAGKTTLIRMITGIFYPDAGNILLNGERFNPVNDVIKIGYMPEERGLYKKMKVGEQAMYLAQLKGLSRGDAFSKVKYWFEKFEMESWWNKKVEDLSKGMGQKLQFVTTVLHEPDLIILDEPFSGLDPVNSNLIKDEIYALAQKGTSIIFSTHRMEQVEEICDHIILVNKGQKILDGGVAAVKQQFKENVFNLELDTDGASYEHPSFHVVRKNGPELVVQINEGYSSNDVLLHFMNQQKRIVAFHELLPSLNDIFIHLVEGTPTTRQFETVTA